mgnify:FL=1
MNRQFLESLIINVRFIPQDNGRAPSNCYMFETMKDISDKHLSTHVAQVKDVDLFSVVYKGQVFEYDGVRQGIEVYARRGAD